MSVRRLQMQRQRIVNGRPDTAGSQRLLQLVPSATADRVLMVDVGEARLFERGLNAALSCESRIVARGDRATAERPFFEMLQLHAKNRGLHFVEPAIEADLFVIVLLAAAVRPQSAHALREVCTVGYDHAAVAACAEVL